MTTLHADDFKNDGCLDMWGALVEDAILHRKVPAGTKASDVEEITVGVERAGV